MGVCRVSRQNEDVLIESDSLYGLSVAVCKLYEALLASVEDGVGYIDISSPWVYSHGVTELSVMSVVIDDSEMLSLGNVLSQSNMTSADVITVGIVSKETWIISRPYIPANYSYELCSIGEDKYFPIIYNTESFENIYVSLDETDDILCVSIGESENELCWISVYEKSSDNRQINIEALSNKMSTSYSGVVATFIGAMGYNSEFCVLHEGVSVEYISSVGAENTMRNVIVMVTDEIMGCDKAFCEKVEGVEAFCIFATVRNIYCSEYLALT